MSSSLFRGLCAVVLISGVFYTPQAGSQRSAMNSIYAEGLGPGLLYSLNYERLVINDLGVRVGFGYTSFSASASSLDESVSGKASMMAFPLTASYLGISAGSHALELGGGLSLFYVSASGSSIGMKTEGSGMVAFGNVLAGYRIHPVNGGFQFRIGFSGLFGKGLGFNTDNLDPDAFGFLPWFYLSLGGCF